MACASTKLCSSRQADWWSENLHWVGHRLHVVNDWDSVTAQPEAILAGEAAYLFAATTFELDGEAPGAAVEETERFLVAFEQARGRPWSADERRRLLQGRQRRLANRPRAARLPVGLAR
jgi:hypothetical protein